MAYTNVSKDYKQIIYSGGAKNQLKVSFNGVELENADYYFEKLVRKGRIIPNGNKGFYLDNFISQTIEATIHDIDLDKIVEPVNISIGTLVNNVYEFVPLGTFNIQDKNKADNDRIILKLEDNAKKFDFNYNGKELIDANGGKATKKQILNDICNKAGVKTKVTTFIGENDEVSTYDNTIKARKYISLLAEQGGGIATIDRDGDLIFVYLNDLHKHKIPLYIVESYDKGQEFKASRVLFEDGVRKFEQGKMSENLFDLKLVNGWDNMFYVRYESQGGITLEYPNFISTQATMSYYHKPKNVRIIFRLFDSNKNLINENGLISNMTYNQFYQGYFTNENNLTFNLPSKVKYIKVNFTTERVGGVTVEDFILNYGNVLFYEPYGFIKNDTIFINANNPYINSQEQINQIYNKVKDFKIDSLTTGKMYGNPTIDSYDLIEIFDNYGNLINYNELSYEKDYENMLNGYPSIKTERAWDGIYINLKKICEENNLQVGDILNCSIYFKTNFRFERDTTFTIYRNGGNDKATRFTKDEIEPNKWYRLNNYFPITEASLKEEHMRWECDYYTPNNPYYYSEDRKSFVWFACPQINNGKNVQDFVDYKSITTLATNELTYKGNMIANYKTTIEISDKRENMTLKPSVATLKRYVNSEIDQVNASIKLQAGEIDKNTSKISSLEVGINGINGSVSSLSTKVNNNYQDIIKKFDDVASTDDLENYQRSMQFQIDSNKAQITSTEQLIANGVPKVNTSTGKFDINGLTMDRNGAKTSTLLNEIGVDVKDKQGTGEDLLFAGYVDKKKATENTRLKKYEGQTVTYSNNMIVDNYFEIGNNSRIQDYEDGGGIFYMGGN